jgi:hypothetical protein
MAEHFRTTKIQKFITKKVEFMEMQQRTIETLKEQGVAKEVIISLEASQTTTYNIVFDLCREFKLKIPVVLGVNQ